jgi:anti-sigma regulatory factor (Ser/Thr protein kinase)
LDKPGGGFPEVATDDGPDDVTVALEYRARFPVDRRAPAAARRLVRCLDDVVAPEHVENLELLVTELVTNAVRHAGLTDNGWVSVEVVVGPATVHVEVCDPGRGFDPDGAAQSAPGEPRGSGWGLFLVDQLATRWGVHLDDCTRVWFDLVSDDRSSLLIST